MTFIEYSLIIITILCFLFLLEYYSNNKNKKVDVFDYTKNHRHINDIISICLENNRITYEDLIQIDILDPTTDEFKFELIAKMCDQLNYRVGELETK